MRYSMHVVNMYLYFGYTFPPDDISWVSDVANHIPIRKSYDVGSATKLFDYIIDDSLSEVSGNGYCVVPISGGWDSRLLLGAALERYNVNEIKTLSFGTPGQLDFDLGYMIANELTVEHHRIDLSQIELTWQKLLDLVVRTPWTYQPDSFFNYHSLSQVATGGDTILSGFLGDPLTGGHLSAPTTAAEAVAHFIEGERRVKDLWLPCEEYNPGEDLPVIFDHPILSHAELLDFGVRQANCIAPIVTPQKRWHQWKSLMGKFGTTSAVFLAPFAHPSWASYWFRAPTQAKSGQQLYLEMMRHRFPRLAALPSKYSLGAKPDNRLGILKKRLGRKLRRKIHNRFPRLLVKDRSHANYLDYTTAFRSRPDFQVLLRESFSYLTQLDVVPWIDLESLENEHMSCDADHSEAFLILIGLALNVAHETNCKCDFNMEQSRTFR